VKGVKYGPIHAVLDKVPKKESSGGANSWITVSIREGKNREIRNVMEHLGLKVSRLIRIQYGPYKLPHELRPGRTVELPLHPSLMPKKIIEREKKKNQTKKKEKMV